MALPFPTNPASQARRDLSNTRAQVGLTGLKPAAAPPPVLQGPTGSTLQGALAGLQPKPPAVTGPANPALKVPGRPADANPWVSGAASPTAPGLKPVTPAPVAPVTPVTPVAPPAVQAAQATPGAATSSFGPGNDLLATQITPTATDRVALANKNIENFKAMLQPDYLKDNRAITQRAAALGRVGNQDNVSDFGGGAGFNTLDKSYLDRVGQYATGVMNTALENQIGDERANRAELRGERGYETDRSDKALEDSIRQKMLEDQLLNSSFGRAQARTATGYEGNPGDTMLGYGGQLAGEAAGSTASGVGLLSRKPPAQSIDYQSLLDALIKQQTGNG